MPRIWDMLTPEQRRLMAGLMGDAIAAEPHEREAQLESLQEIDRLMRLPPGRIEQWPEFRIDRTESGEEAPCDG